MPRMRGKLGNFETKNPGARVTLDFREVDNLQPLHQAQQYYRVLAEESGSGRQEKLTVDSYQKKSVIY